MISTVGTLCTEHNNACWANLAVNSAGWLVPLTIRVALGHKPSSPRGCDLVRVGCCLGATGKQREGRVV